MGKGLVVGVIVLLVLVGGYMFINFTPGDGERAGISEGLTGNTIVDIGDSDKVNIDQSRSNFEFEGFSVGKAHVGGFDDISVDLILEDGEIVGFEGVIQASSVNTGIDGLDTHLRADDFFDVEVFPEIKFVSSSIEEDEASGQLTFRGVTKSITFPVSVGENSVSSEFFLDTTPFNIKFTGVNREVRIAFDFVR